MKGIPLYAAEDKKIKKNWKLASIYEFMNIEIETSGIKKETIKYSYTLYLFWNL